MLIVYVFYFKFGFDFMNYFSEFIYGFGFGKKV